MKQFNKASAKLLIATALFATCFISHAMTIHSADFISDSNRDYFNGFEGLPESPTTTTDYIYIEDNIAHVNKARCIGCGVCVPTCTSEAIQLYKKEEEIIPPQTGEDMFELIVTNKN